MLERLSVDYGKKSKLSFTVWACPQALTIRFLTSSIHAVCNLADH
jgi:hypothetical protein